jgi:putative aldouronate transport system permease protein
MAALRRYWLYYLLIAPALIYFAVFVFYPMGQLIWLSFQKAGILGARGFVGLENYNKIIAAPNVWRATANTLILAAEITFFSTLLPIIPAIALAEIIPGWIKSALQTIIYSPYLLSWVIVIGIVVNTLSPIGLVNSVLLDLHLIDRPIAFFSSPDWAQPLVVGQTVWKEIGFNALIYLSAILSLNPEIIDSAEVDGANGWHKVWDFVIPHIRPMIGVLFVVHLQGALHLFDAAFLMLNGSTADRVTTLAIFAYQRGLLQFDLGMASAAGVVLLGLCLIAVVVTRFLLPSTTRL